MAGNGKVPAALLQTPFGGFIAHPMALRDFHFVKIIIKNYGL